MPVPSFDPVQYKAAQKQDWSAAAAGWKRWWPTFEQSAQRVSDRLVDLAGLKPGHRVLDLGTGLGEPAVTAARRVGPTGKVTAVDQATEMLALARERAAGLGLVQVEFHEMDAEQVVFPEQSFDAVLSRWGLMFLPDLETALHRIHAVLAAGGRLAAAVWAEPSRVPLISTTMGTLRRELGLPPPAPDIPSPFSLAEEGKLERTLRQAGFHGIQTERFAVTFGWPSPEDYMRFQQDIAAPAAALLAKESPERRAAVWRAVAEAARAFAATDGQIRMANEVVCVSARR